VELLYLLTGYGHFFKWGFVVALIAAVLWDFREINRVSDRLPRLPKEELIEPVTEFLTLCRAFLKGRQEWGHALLFLRERRQMAFSLLRGDEATSSKEPLDTLARRRAVLAALGCLLLVAIGALLNAHALSSDTAYFAGLIDDLAEWWDGTFLVRKGGGPAHRPAGRSAAHRGHRRRMDRRRFHRAERRPHPAGSVVQSPTRHLLPAESDRLHPLLVAGAAQTAPSGGRRGSDSAPRGAKKMY